MYRKIKGELFDIKVWDQGIPMESGVFDQVRDLAKVNGVEAVSVMPDAHVGRGSTIGSVIVTSDVVIPSAVGVDLGCGMSAVRLSLKAKDLPDDLRKVRMEIEEMVPVGFDSHTPNRLRNRKHSNTKKMLNNYMKNLNPGFQKIIETHPGISKMSKHVNSKVLEQIGTLGGGNHFIELCIDENQDVWVMLHSGSRGIGNCIGRYFIEKAKKEMESLGVSVPNKDLSYLAAGSKYYEDYKEAVSWAQDYAWRNRQAMMDLTLAALRKHLKPFEVTEEAVNNHHNYINKEVHMSKEVWVTRKGAVSAQSGELGIIPGSMGAKSYIVRGKGNEDSFCSCSHGAGRTMSRSAAKREFTLEDHEKATTGIECRKDISVIDETPAAYKDIDKVMSAQDDLVEVVHTLNQVICVKG